jgi:beta-phosphoglucomutase-like phosphatase (HAD superfamily)
MREIPGATALLRGLHVPCCVASNGPRSKIDLLLRLTGLDAFVPAECAVVEDSLAGIEAGLNAGMAVYAYLPHAPLRPEHRGRVHRLVHLSHLSELLRQP